MMTQIKKEAAEPPKSGAGLQTPVRFVKGVGEARAAQLARLDIETVGDLLLTPPHRYEDRQQFDTVKTLVKGAPATLQGEVKAAGTVRPRFGTDYFEAHVSDGVGLVQVRWYRAPYLAEHIKVGDVLVLHGKVTQSKGTWTFQHPEFEHVDAGESTSVHMGRIVPIYGLTEDLSQRVMRRILSNAVKDFSGAAEEVLPDALRERYRLPGIQDALQQVHFPDTMESAYRARFRLVFEEFLAMQLILAGRKLRFEREVEGVALQATGELRKKFINEVPFELTQAQVRVLQEVREDLSRTQPMHRLLQGDVGSGKTLVAACALIDVLECGYQGAMMAPTEILAAQHANTLRAYLEPIGLAVHLLIGSTPAADRKNVLGALESGEPVIVVGTHAVIQEEVKFKKLGLVVIDEQHKFGVAQRGKLISKGKSPHVLVMTATPIPRTLAMTVYGDLDVSILDEMPEGRAAVVTRVVDAGTLPKVYDFIKEQVAKGRQAYLVYPLVSESEVLDLRSAEEMYEHLKRDVFTRERMALLHGQLRSEEKQSVMEAFSRGELDILVSTTVIEVGVDQPNATVMLIENAERFGLAQLHQLRGRVGRGEHKSYCILQGDPKSSEAWQRLKVMAESRDGFHIAEEDLRIRGMGNLLGPEQSGLPTLRVGNPVADIEALRSARKAAFMIMEHDPHLELAEHQGLRRQTEIVLEQAAAFARVG